MKLPRAKRLARINTGRKIWGTVLEPLPLNSIYFRYLQSLPNPHEGVRGATR